MAQVWALDSALAKRGLWAEWRPEVWGGQMEVGLEVVVWGNVSRTAEQPSVERGMPVGVAWVDVHVVEGEKELKKWLVVSAQGSLDGVRHGWKHGLGSVVVSWTGGSEVFPQWGR